MSGTPSRIREEAGAASRKRVILHLARGPGFPQGSTRHGYEMLVPLRPDGHLDAAGCLAAGSQVRRFWADEPDRLGWLRHRAGGTGGATWVIDYDEMSSDDDEAGYRFDFRAFVPGEYVTIRDLHGSHTLRVDTVDDAPAAESARS